MVPPNFPEGQLHRFSNGRLEKLFNNLQPISVGTWFLRARGAFLRSRYLNVTEVLARRNIRQAS